MPLLKPWMYEDLKRKLRARMIDEKRYTSVVDMMRDITDDEELVADLEEKIARSEIDHPAHYTNHPSGVECIEIVEHFSFCIGNAIKYLWRAGLKGDAIQDLEKSKWYIEREIARRKQASD